MEFRTRYLNPPGQVGFVCKDDGRTRQDAKDECDINRIMKKYQSTGLIAQKAGGIFGDFTGISDFHDAQNRVLMARDEFMSLSSDIRTRFDNDPGKLLAFVADKSNREEAIKLGLITKVPDVKPPADNVPGPDVKPGNSK